ncbi:hypothetical protein J6590_026576 [Homalodisca vitripennis]|nr:hypothetical protein J6590_026576 [Homalodisca vitripennis]
MNEYTCSVQIEDFTGGPLRADKISNMGAEEMTIEPFIVSLGDGSDADSSDSNPEEEGHLNEIEELL